MGILKQDFISPRKNTRPQLKLLSVKGIVMHYTATPKATAKNERNYFNNGAGGRSASAHIFVDKNGAIQIIPFNEVAYHANDHACRIPKLKATASYYHNGGANLTAIGVEMCIEADGSLHPETVKNAVEVVAMLCAMYNLDSNDIYRHYDITGKNCPAMWVSSPSQFSAFKTSVKAKLSGGKVNTPSKETVEPQSPSVSNSKEVGVVTVLADKLNVRAGIGTSYPVVKQIVKGKQYKAYYLKDGWYNLGGKQYVSAKYVSFESSNKYPLPEGILKKGDRGSDVILLQKALVAVNFYPDKNASNNGVDGIFGNDTLDALTRFQKVYIANQVDGIYGQNVRAKLDQLLNK